MRRAEQKIQKAVFDHIRARGVKSMVAFAVPNGGYRSPVEAKILQGQGVKAGIPDICLVHLGVAHFLELKADNGKLTPKQIEMVNALSAAGARTAVCTGLDAALLQLECWGLLRGKAA